MRTTYHFIASHCLSTVGHLMGMFLVVGLCAAYMGHTIAKKLTA